MYENSRPSHEHYCDWSALDASTLIGQKPYEIRGSHTVDIRRISTGGFYNFPALFQLAPGFSNQYRDLLETHIGQCKDKSPDRSIEV